MMKNNSVAKEEQEVVYSFFKELCRSPGKVIVPFSVHGKKSSHCTNLFHT